METARAQDRGGSREQPKDEVLPGETMESLLAQQAATAKKLAEREVAWVKVISVAADQVLVDIGEKREGVVPLSEFLGEPRPGKKPEGRAPAAGQRVPVVLVSTRRDGTTVLSTKRAKALMGWDAAVKSFAEKARVRGQVVSAIKGGFLVDVGGVSAFLPASLADLRPVRNPSRMVGTGVRCYIIELNEPKRQLVLSRKAVLEEETAKRRAEILAELRVGEVRIGRVVGAGPSGLLVDIGGLEGLVRQADVAWGAAQAPAIGRGDKIKVKVLSKPAQEGGPVGLGIKQLTPNPADAVRKKFPLKSVVHGKVVEAGPAGVRIALDGQHAAVSSPAECDPDSACKPGDPVSAIVLGVNPSTFELAVSIARFNEVRDRKKAAQYLKPPPPLTLGQLLSPENKGE